MAKALGGLVDADDLTSLSVGEAIARIGTDVVRIKTIKMPAPPKQNYRDSIIAASREKYYKPLLEVKKRIKARELIARPLVPGVIANADPGEFCYDEFQS